MSVETPVNELVDLDRKLLGLLQQEIPLVPRPFAAIAASLGVAEERVLERIGAMRGKTGIIRQISAIFDSRTLGYRGCLVGAKVDPSRIDDAAEVINRHPGVSHNYRRDHEYNLWYTVAVPPDSKLGLDGTVQLLHEQSRAGVTRLMPTLKMFKIGVRFDMTGEADPGDRSAAHFHSDEKPPFVATEDDKKLIRVLQQDLPAVANPFGVWAEQADVSVDQLLAQAQRYQETGVMRRMAAVIRHRKAGISANAMGAWVVRPDQTDVFGTTAATFAAVSHCYLRPTYPDWPYSIFTMVHGRSRSECEQTLASIADITGINNYAALYSTHEYKKVRVKYFTDDIDAWERDVFGS